MLYVARGESKIVELSFSNSDGSVFNLSGSRILFQSKANFNDSAYLIQKEITGHYAPESGLSRLYLTTGDTNLCPGDYLAGFKVFDISGSMSYFDASGLAILPAL